MKKKFRNLDQYYETINFNYDGGKSQYKTYVGASMTLLLAISVLSFGIIRFHNMIKFVNSNVSTEIKHDYFNDTSNFQ